MLSKISAGILVAAAAVALAPAQAQDKAKAGKMAKGGDMTFFVTSVGKGEGANLGGLEGADAHCNALAKEAGSKHDNWHAYLSTTKPGGDEGVNARDRIGKGPWRNAKGVVIAKNVNDLHSDKNNLTKQTALTEKGDVVHDSSPGNMHDALTGSDPQGMFSTAGGDTTCGNWTRSGDEGSVIVGHINRMGLGKVTRHMKSWNSSHGTGGCSQAKLNAVGGAGLFYCFVPN